MTTLGEKIKKLRKEIRLTQKQLAEKLEVDQSTISYYEQNKKLPDIHTLRKMTEIFDVTLDELANARKNTAREFTEEQEQFVQELGIREYSVETEAGIAPVKKITPEDLKKKFNLVVDGRTATDEEIEEAIRYIAIQRLMKKDSPENN
ncbi:helix-turn-helix domain-containing protein [Cytobacillus kochii]|uniref:helix-turn-helix domain-containing protein n=1 Tax=Cytobacillus kochii TaxID=859143 RepID=UPI00402A7863